MERVTPLLLLLQSSSSSLQECVLQNVAGEMEATSVTLTWEISSTCVQGNMKRFEVQWEHMKYLSCPDGRNNTTSRGVKDDLAVSTANIRNLRPHSIYQFTVKATTRDGRTIAPFTKVLNTKMADPETQPVGQGLNHATQSNIYFYWDDPTNCELQNGQRGGYEVSLEGRDDWEKGEKELDDNNTVDSSYLAHRLKPFSHYVLKVHNRNYDSKARVSFVNYARPLEIRVSWRKE